MGSEILMGVPELGSSLQDRSIALLALPPFLLLPPVPGSCLQGGPQVRTKVRVGTSNLSATLDLTAQRRAGVTGVVRMGPGIET